MKFLSTILLFGLGAASPSPASALDAGRVQTEHLVIEWGDGALDGEIESAKTNGEKFYVAVRDMLGYEPPAKVVVVLGGPFEQDGKRLHPRVDAFGRILLYKYEESGSSYFNALAHEMVHVFRFGRAASADWFFEEGFAEFVALRVDPSLDGFPWYGFPVAIVAGQWVVSGEDIPLEALRTQHNALNLPCRAQAYSLRSAFFEYLGRTHGDDGVIAMSKEEHAGAVADYQKFFGKDFSSLATEWHGALRAQFEAIPAHEELARRFRKESPMQYQPVCEKGKQF